VAPVVVGLVLGSALAFANALICLKIGVWDTGQVTSALLTFIILAPVFRRSGRPFTPHGNVLAMTVSASVAAMPATMGLLAAVPALASFGTVLSTSALLASSAAFGALGVATGAVLAPKLLDEERLAFPSGLASAELIAALHSEGGEARARAVPFLAAFGVAVAVTALREFAHLLPAELGPSVTVGGVAIVLGVASSPMLVGAGALVGTRVTSSIAFGAVVAWVGGAAACSAMGWLSPPGDLAGLTNWLRWPGVCLMFGASAPTLFETVAKLGQGTQTLGAVGGRALGLLALAALAVAGVTHFAFGLAWPWALMAAALAPLLSTVAARAAGASDFAPVSDVGQLAQFGGSLSGSATSGLSAANATASTATQTASMLWALKAGRALGASGRPLIVGQLVGIAVGAPVSVLIWRILTRAYAIGGPELPAPNVAQWQSLAQVLQGGWSALPPGALGVSIVAAIAGLVLSLAEKTRLARWVPSPLGVGLGFLLSVSTGATLLVGALVARRLVRGGHEARSLSVGSGLLSGEAVVVVVSVLLQAFRGSGSM
jgi:uncharacterized oligopeptide transporter (OPT) family protein